MRRAVVVVAAGVLAIAAGVWAWHSATNDQVCERFEDTAIRYPTAEDALADLGLVLTDEASPEFGATLSPWDHSGPVGAEWRDYDIWKDGVVVGSLTLTHFRRRWGVTGFEGCHPIA